MFPEKGQGTIYCTLSCTFPPLFQDRCSKVYRIFRPVLFFRILNSSCDKCMHPVGGYIANISVDLTRLLMVDRLIQGFVSVLVTGSAVVRSPVTRI